MVVRVKFFLFFKIFFNGINIVVGFRVLYILGMVWFVKGFFLNLIWVFGIVNRFFIWFNICFVVIWIVWWINLRNVISMCGGL